jgi:AcrR family transcriptional regulator
MRRNAPSAAADPPQPHDDIEGPSRATAGGGLRERNKIDKLRRIKAAARMLYVSRGFDETTTREIAREADVGLGTLFAYASNKRDLLFLIFNDELDEMIAASEALIDRDAPAIDNLIAVFGMHYEFFGRQPEISRLILRELQFYDTGKQAERFRSITDRAMHLVAGIFRAAIQRGELRGDEDPVFAGAVAFSILRWQLRQWLGSRERDPAAGMADLRRALQLFLTGMLPRR